MDSNINTCRGQKMNECLTSGYALRNSRQCHFRQNGSRDLRNTKIINAVGDQKGR